jgi:hypothetical protein
VDKDFVLLAGCAPFNVLGNPMVHPWPGEAFFCLSNHLVLPQMPCCRVVVYQGHEVLLLGFGDFVNGNGLYEFLGQEHNYVLVVLLPLISVQRPGEDVWPCVGLAGYVVNDEVIFL